jgi:thiol-disulfide isomerase/thioredoxin
MKGKIVVIKCWYIHCAACIKEFPEVNNLVRKYKDRKDIIFISLAEDTPNN